MKKEINLKNLVYHFKSSNSHSSNSSKLIPPINFEGPVYNYNKLKTVKKHYNK